MPQKKAHLPVVLSIAGHDPSSGAGITADIKTIAAHGCYGVTCVTALTVQSTRGVKRIDPVEGRIITETLEQLMDDLEIAAVKIGMLGSEEAAKAVDVLLGHFPQFTVERHLRNFRWKLPGDTAHYRDGLLKAGVPFGKLTLVESASKRTA